MNFRRILLRELLLDFLVAQTSARSNNHPNLINSVPSFRNNVYRGRILTIIIFFFFHRLHDFLKSLQIRDRFSSLVPRKGNEREILRSSDPGASTCSRREGRWFTLQTRSLPLFLVTEERHHGRIDRSAIDGEEHRCFPRTISLRLNLTSNQATAISRHSRYTDLFDLRTIVYGNMEKN